MKLPFSRNIKNEEDTIEVAAEFSKILQNGEIVTLIGNLGAGKTFFVKHLCKNFNIHNVSSPSFAIVNEYLGDRKVYHFDFYRLEKLDELYDIGFDEYLADSSANILIEWADLMPDIIPKDIIEIEIREFENNVRKIEIKRYE